MAVTSGQQYNIGEKPAFILLYTHIIAIQVPQTRDKKYVCIRVCGRLSRWSTDRVGCQSIPDQHLRVWSPEIGSAVPSCVSPLILNT